MKYFLKLTLLLVPLAAYGFEFEIGSAGSIGQRFYDSFDKRWDSFRYDYNDLSRSSEISSLQYSRSFWAAEGYFIFSPVYGHYMGIEFSYLSSLQKYSLEQTTDISRTYTMSYAIMAPSVMYRYYITHNETPLYLSGSMGFNLGSADLSVSGSVGNETLTFDRLKGLRIAGGIGIQLLKFGNVRIHAETGIEFNRLDGLEGSISGGSRSGQSAEIRHNSSKMAIVTSDETANFNFESDSFENTLLYVNGLYLQVGINYHFITDK